MRKTYKKHKGKKYKSHKNTRASHKTIRRHKTRIHKNRTMTGGSLIGQGNFGCAFRPELTAKPGTTHDKNVVSKVVLKNNAFSEYRHEYKILRKMRDLDPKGLFHSLLIDAFDLKKEHLPADFTQCSLTKPSYTIDEFFVFNIAFSGSHNLTYYLNQVFSKQKDSKIIPEPGILFSLLTNIIVGIKKMIGGNILHKTLDTDSVFLNEPVSLTNPYCAKIIDYGDGEVRKYKGYSDKNHDYITFFKSIISILSASLRQQQRDVADDNVIQNLIQGFTRLLSMVETNEVSYNEVIKGYILLLENTFGKKYAEYAKSKYKF
jgi:hypothetical protein